MTTESSPNQARGGSEIFDASWRSARGTDMQQIFTRGRPASVTQLYHRAYVDDLLAVVGPRARGGAFLELGSGRGTTSMYLAARGHDVTLADLSPAALDLARDNFIAAGLPEPKCVLANAEGTGLPEASFDCVYNIGLLEHFEDPRAVIRESVRLLKPGGWLYSVIVPALPPGRRAVAQALFAPWRLPRSLASQAKRWATGYRPRFDPKAPRTDHPRSSYGRWLEEAGAVDVSCVPYNGYHEVHRNRLVQRFVQVPVYEAHLALRRAFARDLVLRTLPLTAQCDLLIGRKPS